MAKFTIEGGSLQTLICEMSAGERLYAETGHVLALTRGLQMNATTKGGFFSGLKRMVGGSTFFVNEIAAPQAGTAYLSSNTPGRIQELDVSQNQFWYCQPHTFLVSEHGVNVEAGLTQNLGAGLFGGMGLILQALKGQGRAYIHLGGASHHFTLAAGETLRVEVGSLAAFSSSVKYQIERVGGLKSMLFSGEGFWFASLTGPGHVFVQSLTLSKLASALIPYLPAGESGGGGAGAGLAGAAIGGLLGALTSSGSGSSDNGSF